MGECEEKRGIIQNIRSLNKKTALFITIVLGGIIIISIINNTGPNYFVRREIFLYLKKMQPIEKEFYNLMDKVMESGIEKETDKEIYSIEIRKILQKTYEQSPNRYTRKNYELFIREIEKAKELIDYHYKDGDKDKIRGYVENYNLVGESRNKNLMEIFEKYNISYIDMEGKIIYETK